MAEVAGKGNGRRPESRADASHWRGHIPAQRSRANCPIGSDGKMTLMLFTLGVGRKWPWHSGVWREIF
jgi:hypothetical protein